MNLNDFGWAHYLVKSKISEQDTLLARITAEHKTEWDMVSDDAELKGIILTSFRQQHEPSELPKVGDFVVYEPLPGEPRAKITKVLPRFSKLSRQKSDQTQVLASNIDVLCIVHGLDQNLNLNQLQRYVALGLGNNLDTVLVLNKIDQLERVDPVIDKIKNSLPEINILETSAKVGTGLEQLKKLIPSGETAVMIGASGAGKSSLLNALLKTDQQAVAETREDGKGRHTTTHREMFVLPHGGIIIDTPGIRTLEHEEEVNAGELIFENLANLAKQCQFRNCDHIKSQGCAIVQALREQTIGIDQYKQYLKLTHPQNYEQMQNDISLLIKDIKNNP